jgi:hypothetical protein
MKKIIFTTLVIFFSTVLPVFAFNIAGYTSANSYGFEFYDQNGVGESFISNSPGYTLDTMAFNAKVVGRSGCDVWAELWSDGGGTVGSLLVSSVHQDVSVFSSMGSNVTFTFSVPYLVSDATPYWAVLNSNCSYSAGTIVAGRDPNTDGYSGTAVAGVNTGITYDPNYDITFSVDGSVHGGGGGPSAGPVVVATSTPMILLVSSVGLFLIQLFGIMCVLYIVFMIIGWPIKRLAYRMKQIIKRAEH